MKKTLQRAGAFGLAAATVVTGLSFGPAATASPTTSPGIDSNLSDQEGRLRGPFIVDTYNDVGFYAVKSPVAGSTLTSSRYSSVADARAAAGTWTFPEVGESGPVRGTGSASDVCLDGNGGADLSNLIPRTCANTSSQTFRWAEVRGKMTLVSSAQRTPYIHVWQLHGSLVAHGNVNVASAVELGELDEIASPTASATYDPSDDSVRFSIEDGMRNTDVYVEDLDGGNSNDGRDRTDGDGNATITLSGAGAGAGEYFRYKFGADGTWATVFTGRTGAIADLRVTREEGGRVRVSGKSSGQPNANVHISRDRTVASIVQTERADGYDFSFLLNETATALDTPYIYSWSQGVRTQLTIDRLTASVGSVDVSNRTARLTGTASPRSFIVINGPTPGQVQAESDGSWSYDLVGLSLGSNQVALEEYSAGVKVGETTVDVTLDVSPVNAAISFPTDLDMNAVASGSAQKGATIIVRDVEGAEIARTAASSSNGAWSVPIPAPNKGGDYDIRINQEVGGDAAGEIVRTVAYGAAVQITNPVEDMAHDGGPVRMTGRGEAGAQIAVREEGRSTVLGTATVLQNGTWNLTTTNVDSGRHVLEATQTGKGNNTTVSAITLNPESAPVAPVAVTNPSNPADGYTPNAPFTFEGTGAPGKTVRVENSNGTLFGQTTVNASGTWSWTFPTPGTATWSLHFIQDKGLATESRASVLDFGPNVPPVTVVPIVVTNPSNSGVGYTPNTPFTFEGIGTIGETIRVEDTSGTLLGQATVGQDNLWSWTLQNPGTATWNLHFVQNKGQANERTARVLNFMPIETPVPAPVVTVTNPANVADGYTPNAPFTFEGTGTAGKTITVTNRYGSNVQDPVTVRTDGTWSFFRPNMGTSTYFLNFIQDKGLATEASTQVWGFAPNADAVPTPVVTVTNPANVADGFAPNAAFTFRGQGTPGKTITVTNKWGSAFPDPATVAPDGTWAWVRPNMGTSTYYLNFVQDIGLPSETSSKVWGFSPNAAPAPVVSLTAPANPALGYTPNTSYTFRGTGTPGSSIQAVNKYGSNVQDPFTVKADGTWEWTRANMGTSIWFLSFVQDQGLPTEASTPMITFAPTR